MKNARTDPDLPSEVNFSKGVRGMHFVPADAKVFMPTSIEQSVWKYYADQASKKGVELSDLLTEVLKKDIESAER